MKNSFLFRFSTLGFFLALFCLLPACDDNFDINLGDGSSTGLKLDVTQQPQVSWLSSNGKTQVILQFSARDSSGAPLTEDQIDVQLKLDGNPIDVESMLNQSSTELEVNLYFAMVLDGSFSMTQHNPPAFEPMKTAARNSYQQVLDLWSTRPGAVKFSLIWFDEVMNQSMYNMNIARDWFPDDILSIPEPAAGTATKLDSAVNVMADYLKAEYDNGIFNGARDQYVMLVFSDGADNYSYWDNSGINSTLSTTSGASYQQYGTIPTTLETAKAAITAHPRLTSHVIGLGSAINASELTQIAQAGNGTFQANPSSQNIGALFQRVLNEFTTILAR
ncbi:MAG: vWA domain-containing protein, partial [Gammaproteobacteria bacterium]